MRGGFGDDAVNGFAQFSAPGLFCGQLVFELRSLRSCSSGKQGLLSAGATFGASRSCAQLRFDADQGRRVPVAGRPLVFSEGLRGGGNQLCLAAFVRGHILRSGAGAESLRGVSASSSSPHRASWPFQPRRDADHFGIFILEALSLSIGLSTLVLSGVKPPLGCPAFLLRLVSNCWRNASSSSSMESSWVVRCWSCWGIQGALGWRQFGQKWPGVPPPIAAVFQAVPTPSRHEAGGRVLRKHSHGRKWAEFRGHSESQNPSELQRA